MVVCLQCRQQGGQGRKASGFGPAWATRQVNQRTTTIVERGARLRRSRRPSLAPCAEDCTFVTVMKSGPKKTLFTPSILNNCLGTQNRKPSHQRREAETDVGKTDRPATNCPQAVSGLEMAVPCPTRQSPALL